MDPKLDPIDPIRARFPRCVVWTPLPFVSWLVPFVGHIGICREDGVILDFAGSNFISVDNFAFGNVARYIPIKFEENPVLERSKQHLNHDKISNWDDALKRSTQEFQHRAYDLFTCNCHCFVANCLNRNSRGGEWNVVNLASWMFLKGKWVNKASAVSSFLPFALVLSIGFLFAGLSFLFFLLAFSFCLVGWFFMGTYCFKNLIKM